MHDDRIGPVVDPYFHFTRIGPGMYQYMHDDRTGKGWTHLFIMTEWSTHTVMVTGWALENTNTCMMIGLARSADPYLHDDQIDPGIDQYMHDDRMNPRLSGLKHA